MLNTLISILVVIIGASFILLYVFNYSPLRKEKVKDLYAEGLDLLGVDIIEAGFPIASKGDFEAVSEVSKIVKNSQVCALSRHTRQDIEAASQALKNAKKPRIHTFISTSPLHMKHKLQMQPEQVLESVKEHVTYARNFCENVEWSCEDGTRTDNDFMCATVEAAIKAGASVINIPDTVAIRSRQSLRK